MPSGQTKHKPELFQNGKIRIATPCPHAAVHSQYSHQRKCIGGKNVRKKKKTKERKNERKKERKKTKRNIDAKIFALFSSIIFAANLPLRFGWQCFHQLPIGSTQ
jgi:hypothetical protein